MNKANKKTEFFTLIELLATIAVIMILASLLLPVIGEARARGKAIACLSHQRQIFFATNAYLADNDDIFPAAFSERCAGGDGIQWFEQAKIGGYLGSFSGDGQTARAIFSCPALPESCSPCDYAAIADIWGSDWTHTMRRISQYTAPQDKVLVYDAKPWFAWGAWATLSYTSYIYYQLPPAYNSRGSGDFRHLNGHNLVFLDGHARRYAADPDDVHYGTGWRYRRGRPTGKLLTAYAFNGEQ